uniref:stage III sporulation protein AE n=1 Tax=Virgibacillus alimentarius TaxID=698769 RepID=UPI000ABF9AC9|nr:stage III sporulation protein AE [Virgibacillus alimentarius]
MKQYKLRIAFTLAVLMLLCGQPVFASDTSDTVNKKDQTKIEDAMLDEISLDGIQEYWNELVTEYGGYIPELEKTSIYEFIKNNGSFSLKSTLIGFVKYLFYELLLNGKLLGLLLLLTLFSIVLQTVQTAFEHSAVSKIAYFVVYIVLIYIALNSFYLAFSYAKDSIDAMSSFMIAMLPLILGLMASFGNMITVSFFSSGCYFFNKLKRYISIQIHFTINIFCSIIIDCK